MSAPNPYAAPIADINAPIVAGADNLPLAGRGSRLGSYLLDLLVGLVPGLPMIIGGFMMMAAVKSGPGGQPPSGLALALMGIGGLGLLALGIFQIYRVSTTGQTLGKKWVGVRIVKLDGSPVNFTTAFLLRMFVPGLIGAVPYLGMVFTLVDILFIFREDRRCIHDLIAGTRVVELPHS
jgi:uncharacterized RDD family membrane protein YckC